MKLHTDTLTYADLQAASVAAGAGLVEAIEHGSKSRRRAFEVRLSGHGVTGGQYGAADFRTATWDEYGLFLAHLFAHDSSLTIPWIYESHDMFTWSTASGYEPLAREPHLRHKWQPNGVNVTRSYASASCRCGAMRRWLMPGHTFAELVAR